MPVDDHPVHESTKIDADFRYGCWNVPLRAEGYFAHPWSVGGSSWVPFRMSHGCMYDLWKTDPACAGCAKEKVSGLK